MYVYAALSSIFKTLGVDAPLRSGPLRLTTQTVRHARALLEQFGLDHDQSVAIYAPDAATTLKNQSIASPAQLPGLPVVLMPPGKELHLIARLAGFRPGVTYLICHPARGGEELETVTPDSAHARDYERQLWAGAEGRAALERHGIQTVGMRALRDLLRA